MWTYNYTNNQNELMHYGVLGMKWGVRKYQNPDGTLTSKGRKKYGKDIRLLQTYNRIKRESDKKSKKLFK